MIVLSITGVDQPGFLHCCNFLLPWEVGIHGDKDKWPSIADMSTKKSRRKGPKDIGDLSVTVYLGHEYECPRGHRFFISSPEKIFKAPASGQFKVTNQLGQFINGPNEKLFDLLLLQ